MAQPNTDPDNSAHQGSRTSHFGCHHLLGQSPQSFLIALDDNRLTVGDRRFDSFGGFGCFDCWNRIQFESRAPLLTHSAASAAPRLRYPRLLDHHHRTFICLLAICDDFGGCRWRQTLFKNHLTHPRQFPHNNR